MARLCYAASQLTNYMMIVINKQAIMMIVI